MELGHSCVRFVPSGCTRLYARFIWVYYKRFDLGWIPRLLERFAGAKVVGAARVASSRLCVGAAGGGAMECVVLLRFDEKVCLKMPWRFFWVGPEADVVEAEFVVHVGHFGRKPDWTGTREELKDCLDFDRQRLRLWMDGCGTKFGEPVEDGLTGPLLEKTRRRVQRLKAYERSILKRGGFVRGEVYGLPGVLCCAERRADDV